jgi:hypothetical protein
VASHRMELRSRPSSEHYREESRFHLKVKGYIHHVAEEDPRTSGRAIRRTISRLTNAPHFCF